MLFVFLFFFVNDTATTEIYTYRHTLSLHDALPISPRSIGPTSGARPPRCWAARGLPATAAASKNSSMERPSTPPIPRPISPAWRSSGSDEQGQMRSEEHTSELQSLMRISYAVFCLKKKQKTTNIHTMNTYAQ